MNQNNEVVLKTDGKILANLIKAPEKNKNDSITIDVEIDSTPIDIILEKLKEANSLADELASKLSKMNI